MEKKELTPEEKFAACDFKNKDSIVTLFPRYVQEQHNFAKESKKPASKSVNIEDFNLKTYFGDGYLLKNTELILEAGKRQVLYGANGTGKTMLFMAMTSGGIKEFPKTLHVHHCKELENHELSGTVLDTVVNSHEFRNALVKCEAHLTKLVETAAPEDKEALTANLDWIKFQMRTINGYDAKERAEKMLRVLGFDEDGMSRLCSALSGGLRMRVALCMAFFIDAELLLLDEPTNHLDFPSVLWLENRLRAYRGSFLLVSHDRELLNNVCQSVLLLEDKQIKYYAMGFKEFEKKTAIEDKKKAEDIEKFLKKHTNVDPSTPLGKSKNDKQQWQNAYYQKQVALAGKFTFPAPVPLENTEKNADGTPINPDDISLIDLKDVTFSYDVAKGNFIFKDPISFKVTATTRVGVMGPNGAGKSTLLKLLTHKLTPVTGTVTHHPKFTLAYFGQHSTAELELEMTPIEFMCKSFPGEQSGILRNHLGKTGIVGNVADTRMQSLSYSQRSCIIFAKLTFVCPHLLIMDEPTNFLDLESVDCLISAANKYRGALLLVSHNRDFLKKCAKQYLSVVPGQFLLFDNMKKAEQATYTFIAEMEEGVKVGADALQKVKGGASLHSASIESDKPKAAEKDKDGVVSISFSAPAAKPKVAAAPVVTYAVGEKVQALWSDGKYYAGVIKKVVPGKGYLVTYTQYGNDANLDAKSLKKAEPAPAKGAPAAKGAPQAAKKK